MQGEIFSTVLFPLILGFIMFSLGLGLRVADFQLILRQPRALLVGLVCHFLLLPLACYGLIQLFGMTGYFAVGFMLLAACPTGTTSNLLTYLARGDVALALSFTAVASVLTIFTLPLIVSWSLTHFLAANQVVQVPVSMIMGQVLLILGLPVALGMLTRHFKAEVALRLEPKATKVATALFVLIVALAVMKHWNLLLSNFSTLAPFALILNLSMLALGFFMAWIAGLSRRQSITLGIETAMQNASLALVVAATVLKQDEISVPGAIYGILMYVGGLMFALFMRRFTSDSQ
ncbi:MAG: bile acid:sodium symporter [Ideonella sp. MAG2]|nr:MAG: bile acid:sodium symporter [Ideonella sp. MAG2]